MMTTPASPLRDLFALPDYRRLWAIGAGVGIARWLEFLALGVFAYQITGSPKLVALIAIVRMIPYAAFGFVMGAMADFLDRRRLMIGAFTISTTTSIAMALLAAAGHAGYGAVLVAAAVSGLVWLNDMPVRRRLLVDAAGAERISSALGFDNSTAYLTRALGPLAGGLIYQWVGIAGVFTLSATVYMTCLVLAIRITKPASDVHGVAVRPRVSLITNLFPPRSLVLERRFLVIMGVTAIYNLFCFPFITMVPVIAQKDFALTPAFVGALSACDGIGGTLGAIAFGYFGSQRKLFPIYFFGVSGFLALVLALSLWLSAGAAAVTLLMIGVAAACFSATQYALVYTMSAPETRGRATGFLSLFIGLSTIGFWHTGYLFAQYPSAEAMRIMAVMGLVPMLVFGILWLRAKP